jgi:dTDP-4-amino-4,6-dideoxygalactose transaminase
VARIYLSPPDVGPDERRLLLEAFDSNWVAPVGPDLGQFEEAMAQRVGVAHAAAVASGTAALHLALRLLGVQPGDEVLVPTLTFVATANAVTYTGATPVFVDSETTSWCVDPALVAEAIEQRAHAGRLPAAVITVDLYGQCADHGPILEVCARHGIPVVEDAAEGLGATWEGRQAGSIGRVGILSFNGNKIITTSSGGMLLTPDEATSDRVRSLSTQARRPVVHYEHEETGFNYRMSNLLAGLGSAQLQRLDAIIERKLAINAAYRWAFADSDLEFMPVPDWSAWNGWLTCVLFPDRESRDRAMSTLTANEIESRPLWKPMHRQPLFAGRDAYVDGTSDDLFDRGLCLPSGAGLNDGDVHRISQLVSISRTARTGASLQHAVDR